MSGNTAASGTAPSSAPADGKYAVDAVPADLDERLKKFMKDDTQTKLDLPPTQQKIRHQIHDRALKLGLVAVSEGVGADRHAVIYKSNDADAIRSRLQVFVLSEHDVDRLDLPPAPEPIRYSTRLAARQLGLTAISEGVGKNRHTVVWKALTEKKIDEQLRNFAANPDPAVNRLEFPPASGPLRYFTASAAEDYGLTSISEGQGAERHNVLYKVPPAQHRQLQRQQLQQLFDSLDLNRDGQLDLNDVQTAMRVQKLPESFADNFFHSLNKPTSGHINFDEFYEFVSSRDRAIRAAFNAIDTEHTGAIPLTKVRRALHVLNMYPTGGSDQGLLNALMTKGERKVSANQGSGTAGSTAPAGQLSYEEFRDFCALLTPVDFGKLNDEWLLATDENMVWAAWGQKLGRLPSTDGEKPPVITAKTTAATFDWAPLWSGFAGGIANSIARTCVAPAERVRLQMSVDPAKYGSMINCFKEIQKAEGWKGYWRGNWINIIRIFPQGAVAFFTNDFFKEMFGGRKASQAGVLAASMLSGMFCMTAVYPLDMIRGRVSTTPGLYKGLWDGLRTVYQKEGARALYLGLGPGNAWAIPYYGAQFYTYETLKRSYAKYAPKDTNGKPPHVGSTLGALFGAISGAVCVTVAYPFELVRRRLQTQGIGGRPIQYAGMVDCFQKVVQKEGAKGLFRGLVANLLKTPASTAIVFMTHESLLKIGPGKKHH